MGDTQLGGDKEQTGRMDDIKALVAQYEGKVDHVWHVGDLGTSSTAYDFLAAFKALGKIDMEKLPTDVKVVQVEIRNALEKAFNIVADRTKDQAKYVMGKVLRGKENYPEIDEILTKFSLDSRVVNDPKLNKFVSNGKLDIFKIITGKDINFLEADKEAMLGEINGALQTMSKLSVDGKIGVVPGNSEISNWKRVTEEVLPRYQQDVDLERNPSVRDLSESVGLISLPYELQKDSEFDVESLVSQVDGKETVIIGMHASPLMRGLAENLREPVSVGVQRDNIIKNLNLGNFLDTPFENTDMKIRNALLRRAGGFEESEFNGKNISDVIDLVANKLFERSLATYEKRKLWDQERQAIISKHGKPDRTPGSQINPINIEFRTLVRSLPDSVKTIIVPWGHLHSTSEKALANHPWFKYDEEIQPQSFVIADSITGKHREIKFIYLPTAAVVIMNCYPNGVVDIKSLKQVVEEIK